MKTDAMYQDDKYQIRFDQKNGYYRLFPLPSKEELDDYYKKDFYAANYNKQINDSSKSVQKEEEDFVTMQFDDIIETMRQECSGNELIDIGCGYGNFMKYCAARGYRVFGLDPAQEAVDSLAKEGVAAVRSDIEDMVGVLSQKYDIAVMLNVFEHLREPKEVLYDIRDKVLNKDGLLVIRVPNEFNRLQIIANQEYKLKSWWVSPPQHISYFTPEHLQGLLERCGFEVRLLEATFPLEMFILMGDQYVGDPVLGKEIHNKRVLFEKTLKKYDNAYKRKMYQAFAEIGLGREITVFAKRKS